MIHLSITISHLFVCLTTLKLATFEPQVFSRKVSYANALSLGTNSCKKKKRIFSANIDQRTSSKKAMLLSQLLVRTISGQLTKLYLNLVNLSDLFGVGRKLKESVFKNNNQINSTVTTKSWVLSTEWTRTWPKKYKKCDKKMVVVPICLNSRCCSLECMKIVLY